MIGFLAIIVAGGIGLYIQIGDLKSDIRDTKHDVSGALERLGKIEDDIAELKASQSDATNALSRIEDHVAALQGLPTTPPSAPQLLISVDDAKFIRSWLKFNPAEAYKGVGRVGDVLKDVALADFPSVVLEKFPLLKNMRYTFDLKGESPNSCVA